EESAKWQHIVDNMYLPEDSDRGVFLQQDGFLDKELIPVADLPIEARPLNQHWSWDRILRSCYIKQADVLQGIYFFEDEFDEDTIRRNYDFYEPLTVHESSLSPCVHAIIAAKLGKEEKAYEFYLRTARLDLDDYTTILKMACISRRWQVPGWRLWRDLPVCACGMVNYIFRLLSLKTGKAMLFMCSIEERNCIST